MIAKNDEEKRSHLWNIIMTVSTVLFLAVVIFFVVRMFTMNPLIGKWSHQDSSLALEFKNKGNVSASWETKTEGDEISIDLEYILDKDSKAVTVRASNAQIEKAAEESEGAVTVEGLQSVVESIEGTYTYNIENKELSLMDKEYGNSMVFDKK